MKFPDPESTYGQKTDFLRALCKALLQEDNSTLRVLDCSPSEAFLAYFGSPEAVDQALGEGTFQGVKSPYGPLAGWRKLLKNVQAELRVEAQEASLATLTKSMELCRQLGLSEDEIQRHVESVLHPEGLSTRFPTIFGTHGSQNRTVKIIVSH